jgi:hypothetical protein
MTKDQINAGRGAQEKSGCHLTDEQLAELRRRRAEKNPRTLTLAELDKRLRRFGL